METMVGLIVAIGITGGFASFMCYLCENIYWFFPKKIRGFEVVSTYDDIELPERQTKDSAGYDICVAKAGTIAPGETKVFPTGLKAYMLSDEFLGIHIRSSVGIKRGLVLGNITGVIDSDYYDNSDNEGHIMIALKNIGSEPQTISDGERIAQGIFYKYLKVDGDKVVVKRSGGIGSTL